MRNVPVEFSEHPSCMPSYLAAVTLFGFARRRPMLSPHLLPRKTSYRPPKTPIKCKDAISAVIVNVRILWHLALCIKAQQLLHVRLAHLHQILQAPRLANLGHPILTKRQKYYYGKQMHCASNRHTIPSSSAPPPAQEPASATSSAASRPCAPPTRRWAVSRRQSACAPYSLTSAHSRSYSP